MKRRSVFRQSSKTITGVRQDGRVWWSLAALALCVLFSPAGLGAPTPANNANPTQASLTPLQRAIEKERQRLISSDTEERRDAVSRLGALARPESSRAAGAALSDAAAIVRATAVRAVLSLPPEEATPLLLPLLSDRDEFVRREAAYALGMTRSRAGVTPLINALESDKSPGVRGAAAVSLGLIGDETAAQPLAHSLVRRISRPGFLNRIARRRAEENEFVRRAAVRALGDIGSRDAVPALIGILSNERAADDVRREAARSLGRIGDAAAIPALQRAALDALDPYFSQHALEALRKLERAGVRKSM
ncbi:MAG TPA: HEAT repeat domain-containing protein [Pyrinomonadaceae bacterium]|jgi:HEAT repeat protein|nr:HEAT repeat domain-containing protein [Pyrinomonadaceae bacterium]